MIKPELINGELYHIYNRGVEKRRIFENESDYYRFVFLLYECNDSSPVLMRHRIAERRKRKVGIGETYANFNALAEKRKARDCLVELVAFTLMPNHYHLIVRQVAPGGTSLFMKKLSNGYTGYFNGKHNRRGMGGLFQGAFRATHIESDKQLLHLAEYIFSNPAGIVDSDWKNGGIKNPKKTMEFLNNYRWSSYSDSIGKDNFPSVTQREFLWKVFGGLEPEFIKGKNNIEKAVGAWVNRNWHR